MVAQVLSELGQHLEDADRYAAAYAKDYVASIMEGGPTPRGTMLHPCVAKLVREVCLDAQVSARRLRMVA